MRIRANYLIVLLLQQILLGQVTGSGSGMFSTGEPPKCMEATPTDVCSIIPSSTSYQFTTTPNFDDIFKLVRDEVTNSTFICNQFYIFSACFYSFRECDPSNNGSQLPICQEICPLIDKLYDDCINPYVLKWLIDKTENSEVKQFLEFSEGFKCSKKETYVLPNVTFSTGRCSNFSFIRELIPDPGVSGSDHDTGPSFATKIGLGVGIPLAIILLVCVVVILLVLVVKLHVSKARLQRGITGKMSLRNEYNIPVDAVNTAIQDTHIEDVQLSAEERCYYEEKFDSAVVSFDLIEILDTIGEGMFGVVCKAMLVKDSSTQLVAVKMARNLSSKQELRSLLNESLLMKRFDHPNIVGLLGVCFDTPDGYPYLILPFMANGNIRDYLKDKRIHPTNISALPDDMSVKTLVTMCVDVAKGMEYLSSNKFVHRDLAARNCMLDEKGIVRVGDFGLARDVYSHLYYRADKHSKIPVKWSAPEMLNDGLCTEKSDVWSYGVVCWEVFSLGTTPYPGVTNYDIPEYIGSGKRLKKPLLCPQDIYALMEACWKMEPEERPYFKQLASSMTAD